jgi:putative FmdB family regulatory protein
VPTYQYVCTECDERLEAVQKFTDDPLTECAVCGGRLRKQFSAVGIVFKGSGFYRTDSRKGADVTGAKPKDAAASSSDKSSGDSGGSSGSDTKSPAKTEKSGTSTPGTSSSSSSAASTKVA